MKQTKKAIRLLIEDALHQVTATLDLTDLSSKSRKAIQQASKDLSRQLRDDLKKEYKKQAKVPSSSKKGPRKNRQLN